MESLLDFFEAITPLSNEARLALGGIIHEKTYPKHTMIQLPGSTCRTLYFVKEGGARIFYYKDGNDVTEHFAFHHDIIVRAESLFTQQPTSKGIETIEKTSFYTLDSEKLFALYNEYHEVERLFRILFEREFVAAIRRIESFQLKTAHERYEELLETTNLIHTIPLKFIASYLGISQVSLSRIRAGLQ